MSHKRPRPVSNEKELPRSIDAIQIRPLLLNGSSGAKLPVPTTLRLPVTLGRQTLAMLWWKACPAHCQAWKPASVPCAAHCRAVRVRTNLGRLSRSLVEFRQAGTGRVTAKHKSLVYYTGPRRLRHARRVLLSIGDEEQAPWMAFQIVGVSDPRQGTWRQAGVTPALHTKRRIWFESSSSSGSQDEENSASPNLEESLESHHNKDKHRKQSTRRKRRKSKHAVALFPENQQESDLAVAQEEDAADEAPTRKRKLAPPPTSRTMANIDSWMSKPKPAAAGKEERAMVADNDDDDDNVDDANNDGEVIIPCHVLRRDCNAKLPRKVTPDEKRRKVAPYDRNETTQKDNLPIDDQQQHEQAEQGEVIIPCQVIRRDCEDSKLPPPPPQPPKRCTRATSPDRMATSCLHNNSPLTQTATLRPGSYTSQTTSQPTSQRATAAGPASAAPDHDNHGSPYLSMPYVGSDDSGNVAEIPMWQEIYPGARVTKNARDLTLADWRRVQETAPPQSVLEATSALVVSMNHGRADNSINLYIPDLLGEDLTVLL